MSTFQAKNIQRRTARNEALDSHPRGAVNEARRARRVRWNGAFGQAPNHIFNMLAVGTTASTRSEPKGDDLAFIKVVNAK